MCRSPGTSPKVSLMTEGTCGAYSTKLILPKNLPWTPPPLMNDQKLMIFDLAKSNMTLAAGNRSKENVLKCKCFNYNGMLCYYNIIA